MYRGFSQNKKHSFYSRAFSRKAPVSRKGLALTLSTEIICRSGFFFGFAVTSRVSPIHRIFTQRIYLTKSARECQAFMQDFRKFFEKFFDFCDFFGFLRRFAPCFALLRLFHLYKLRYGARFFKRTHIIRAYIHNVAREKNHVKKLKFAENYDIILLYSFSRRTKQ